MPTTLTSPGPALSAAQPHGLAPVPLVARPDPFDDPAWVFEPKYDGIRGFLHSVGGVAELRARQEIRVSRLEELCERIAGVLHQREVILDGEVVALDRQGKPSFRDLIRGEGYLAFAVFDLLWLDGKDLRNVRLDGRKRMLAELLPEDTGPLYKILTLDEYGRALFGAIRKMDLAGVVAKRKDEPYGPGTTWLYIANPAHAPGEQRLNSGRRTERRRTAP